MTVLSLNKSQLSRVIRDLLLILRCRVELFEESGNGFEVTAKGDLTNYEDFADIVESCVELGELSTVMAIRIHGKDSSEDVRFYLSHIFLIKLSYRIMFR